MWMNWYKVRTFKENTKRSQILIQLNTQSPKVSAWLKLRSTLMYMLGCKVALERICRLVPFLDVKIIRVYF
jgi:hypothetical protein